MGALNVINGSGASITLDSNGDIPDANIPPGVARGTIPTVNNGNLRIIGSQAGGMTGTDTNFTANDASSPTATLAVRAGSGITVGTGGVSHADTSSQGSVNNSGNTVIQDITLDTYGHVTNINSTTLSTGGSGNNTSTTAVGAYAMVGATNPRNTNVGTGTSFAGNSSTYQYGGIGAGTNNYRLNLLNTGEIVRNGNIPAGTWHFRGAGGQNTGRMTLCQRTA